MLKSFTNKFFSKGNARGDKSKEPTIDHKENESRSDQLGGANESTDVSCPVPKEEATDHKENEISLDKVGDAKKTEKGESSHVAEGEGSLIGQNNPSSSKVKMKPSTRRKGGDKVMIQNLTEKTLVFKEMIRSAHGPVRYVIEANDVIKIKLTGGLNTYYRLIVYAIEEVVDSPSSSTTTTTTTTTAASTPPTPQGHLKSMKKPMDTGLTVDSDFLSDNNCIFISGDKTKGYTISTKPPRSL